MTNAPVQDSRPSPNYPRVASIHVPLRQYVLISDRNLASGVAAAAAAAAALTGCDVALLRSITVWLIALSAAHTNCARSNPDGRARVKILRVAKRIICHARRK